MITLQFVTIYRGDITTFSAVLESILELAVLWSLVLRGYHDYCSTFNLQCSTKPVNSLTVVEIYEIGKAVGMVSGRELIKILDLVIKVAFICKKKTFPPYIPGRICCRSDYIFIFKCSKQFWQKHATSLPWNSTSLYTKRALDISLTYSIQSKNWNFSPNLCSSINDSIDNVSAWRKWTTPKCYN